MKVMISLSLCTLITLLFLPNPAHTQEFIKKEVWVKMEDGNRLATDIYLPDSLTKYPVILVRTPYQKEGIIDIARHFVKQGFAVAVQDVRGKNRSEGNFIPFLNEKADGIQTLDWISTQSWSNGSIGLWGSSYLGYAALVLADTGHPALKSIFHYSGWLNGALVNSPGGAFHQQLIIPWLMMEGQDFPETATDLDMEEILTHQPLKEVYPSFNFQNEKGEHVHLSIIDTLHKNFNYTGVTIPVFHLTGWYDFVARGSLDVYKNLRRNAVVAQHLRIGPWYHNQLYDEFPFVGEFELPDNAREGLDEMLILAADWFNQTLNPASTPHSVKDKVSYYILFENTWRESTTWPPQNISTQEFYLSEAGLITEKTGKGTSRFIYDPNHLVPTTGGANFNLFPDDLGIRDQEEVENRDDVLLFTSKEFPEDGIYAGPVRVNLFVGSDARGTDFTAKLTKVDTQERSFNLADGIVRISPEKLQRQPQPVTVELGDIAFMIRAGEKLRLQVSSSNFPKFNRNPNTGIDPVEADTFSPATQTIFHNHEYPSKLILQKLSEK